MSISINRHVVLAIAIIAIAAVSIGVAYAYVAETINSGNNTDTKPMTVIVSESADDPSELMEVKLPIPSTIEAESENGPWSFNDSYEKRISGYIYAQCPDDEGKMRVWIDMENMKSWSVVDRVTFSVYDDDLSRGKVTFQCDNYEEKVIVLLIQVDAANTSYSISATGSSPGYTIKGLAEGSTVINTSYNSTTKTLTFQCPDKGHNYLALKVQADSGKANEDLTLSAGSGYTIKGLGAESNVQKASLNETTNELDFTCGSADERVLVVKVKADANSVGKVIQLDRRGGNFNITGIDQDKSTVSNLEIANKNARVIFKCNDTNEKIVVLKITPYSGKGSTELHLNYTGCTITGVGSKTTVKDVEYDSSSYILTKNAKVAYQYTLFGADSELLEVGGEPQRIELPINIYNNNRTEKDWNGKKFTIDVEYKSELAVNPYNIDDLLVSRVNFVAADSEPIPSLCIHYCIMADATTDANAYNTLITKTYAYQGNVLNPPNTPTGYQITGWYLKKDSKTGQGVGEEWNFANNHLDLTKYEDAEWKGMELQLYARYDVIDYHITFVVDGLVDQVFEDRTYTVLTDTLEFSSESSDETPVPKTATEAVTGKVYNLKGFTGTGLSGIQKNIIIPKGSVGDRTYSAVWTYNVTFSAGSGSGTMEKQTISRGAITNLSKMVGMEPPSGMSFYGWSCINGQTYADGQEVMDLGNVSMTAIWGYIVSFNANGGSGSMDSQIVLNNSPTPLNKNKFTSDSNVFYKWDTNQSGSGTILDGGDITIADNTTLYAIWGTKRTVTFDANGGTGTMEPQSVCDSLPTHLNMNKFVAPNGKIFLEWNTNPAATGVSYVDGQSIITTADLGPLYAIWVDKRTIIFDANGGTGTMEPQGVCNDVETKLDANEYTKDGWTFIGWNTNSNATVALYTDEQLVTITADLGPLYAIWSCDLSFDNNGGDGSMSPLVVYPNAVQKTVPANGFTAPTGKVFCEWNTSPDGKGVSYSPNNQILITGATTLYAIWGHTITFNANGGVGSMTVQNIPDGILTKLEHNEYSKEGQSFYGWIDSTGIFYGDKASVSAGAISFTGTKNVQKSIGIKIKAGATNVEYALESATGLTFTNVDASNSNVTIISFSSSKITFRCQDTSERLIVIYLKASSNNSYTLGSGAGYVITGYENSKTSVSAPAFVNRDLVLTAQWDYTVTFDLGVCPTGFEAPETQIVKSGDKATEPDMELDGYRVTWFNSANDQKFNFNTPITTNVSLYAKWDVEVFLICNPLGDNDQRDMSAWFPFGESAKINNTIGASNNGKQRFADDQWGWNTNDTGRGAYFEYDDDYVATYPRALYAIWHEPPTRGPPNPYVPWANNYITYYTNGGVGYVDKETVPITGSIVLKTINSSQFYKEGVTFDHWNTKADGSGTNYSNGQSGVTLTGSIVLFAVWNDDGLYEVRYDSNYATGGAVPEAVSRYAKDTEITVSSNSGDLVRTGYTFNGWNTAPDGSGTSYSADDKITIKDHVVLYAEWTPIERTVTKTLTNTSAHGANKATIAADYTATLSANEGYDLPLTITVKVGEVTLSPGMNVYTYDSSTGELVIKAAQITDNVTIIAQGVSQTP